MRLAALTASADEIEELSKTFKMARPSIDEINRGGVASLPKSSSKASSVNAGASRAQSSSSKGGSFFLFALLILIVIGLISAVLF